METWKEYEHNIISHSAAHHLMAIADLTARFGYARVSDVARELGITRGSVSISLRPLKDVGLILQDENKHLRLSSEGQALVSSIKTKRVLIQRLFTDVLGVAPEQGEIDACKLEHLISNETAQRIVAFLRFFDSGQGPAACFTQLGRDAEIGCQQQPETCPSCQSECLASNVGSPPSTEKPR